MYSTHNEGKCVIAERFIRFLKNKIYKQMTSMSIYIYIYVYVYVYTHIYIYIYIIYILINQMIELTNTTICILARLK